MCIRNVPLFSSSIHYHGVEEGETKCWTSNFFLTMVFYFLPMLWLGSRVFLSIFLIIIFSHIQQAPIFNRYLLCKGHHEGKKKNLPYINWIAAARELSWILSLLPVPCARCGLWISPMYWVQGHLLGWGLYTWSSCAHWIWDPVSGAAWWVQTYVLGLRPHAGFDSVH